MDTANNPKILVAERCVRNMEKYIGNIRELKKDNVLKEIESKIMEIKYSYSDFRSMAPMLKELQKLCKSVVDSLGGDRWTNKLKSMKISELAIAHVKFCLNILFNLEHRLQLPDYPEYAVDIRIGAIESVMKHPHAARLKICNVNVGRIITVVTNIESVKEGEKLPVALLPPEEFFNVVSEGMFLSHTLKDGTPSTLPKLTEDERNSARKEVLNYLR